MTTLWQDMRYAFRRLRRTPGFTAIALITLAVGIGANTVMFSISDVLLFLRAKQVKNPDQLMYCALQGVDDSNFRPSEYLALRDSNLAFSDVLAQITLHDRATMVRRGSAWRMWSTYVSANYFSVLGATPVQGRGFRPEEEQQGSAPVVVLSYRWWKRLGGSPKLIGQFVNINGTNCQIVGVAPKGFGGATLNGWDMWLPLGSLRTVHSHYRSHLDREPSYYVIGRLKPDVTMPVAQAQVQGLIPRFRQEHPERWNGRPAISLRLPGRTAIDGDFVEDDLFHIIVSLVLMTASGIVLVIACLNLANMLIVQGTSRQREIAVRLAIGGGRWRIIRQLLVESGLLALLGGVLGILLACGGMRVLNAWILASEYGTQVPQVGLNVRVLEVTLGLCLLATLLFGLRPALWLSKRDIAGEMKGSTDRVLGSRRSKRGGLLMAGQIALAVALVLSATLLTRSALKKAQPDARFCLTDKLVIEIDPRAGGYDRPRALQACGALADHLASLPEVKTVGTSSGPFFGGGGLMLIGEYRTGEQARGSGKTLARQAALVGVGREYFQAMEIPLLRGRLFDQHDHLPDAERVAIIDESLARQLRPDGNALGCLVQWGVLGRLVSDPYRVVGIVAHLPGIENRDVRAQMYTPIEAGDLSTCFCLHVVNAGSADVLRQRILDEIHRADPQIAVFSVATLAEKRYDHSSVWVARFGARLGLAAGAAALFLATLGIYAIKSYMVASRTSEIGIRMALGATREGIMGMVLREGLLLTTVSLLIGLALGLAVAKIAARFLYGVGPIDPVSIAVTVALLGAASLLAGCLPARRAAKIDPMEALRYE